MSLEVVHYKFVRRMNVQQQDRSLMDVASGRASGWKWTASHMHKMSIIEENVCVRLGARKGVQAAPP